MKILLIDDDDVLRAAIKRFLKVNGYEVFDKDCFSEACNFIDENLTDIDVLITDFDLGMKDSNMSGADIIWYLQTQTEEGWIVKTVMLSGLDRSREPDLKDLRIDQFLTKDNPDKIISTLEGFKK